MKSFAESVIIKKALAMFKKADARGWHERNGGNLTYRLTEKEVEDSAAFFREGRHFTIDVNVPSLGGEYFLTTNAGSYIGSIPDSPATTLSVARIDDDGNGYTLMWDDGIHKPTSEFSSHLIAHSEKIKHGCRVIYHSHPEHLIALTFILPLTPEAFSNALWRSISECALVYPEGIGVIPWKIPGSRDIALTSAVMFHQFNIIVWAHHGVFSAGNDFNDAFSLIDVAEKAARIYLLYSSRPVLSTISKSEIEAECKAFGVEINKELLK